MSVADNTQADASRPDRKWGIQYEAGLAQQFIKKAVTLLVVWVQQAGLQIHASAAADTTIVAATGAAATETWRHVAPGHASHEHSRPSLNLAPKQGGKPVCSKN